MPQFDAGTFLVTVLNFANFLIFYLGMFKEKVVRACFSIFFFRKKLRNLKNVNRSTYSKTFKDIYSYS